MHWFLHLFPQYRAMEKLIRDTADRLIKVEDLNYEVTLKNLQLTSESQASRDAEIAALKMICNIKVQRELGGLPPYPEAYSLPKEEEADTGAISTNRVHGRDAVKQGLDDFHASIRNLTNRQPRG